jgi:ribosomal protein S18 acetylase RimI-like enzyme
VTPTSGIRIRQGTPDDAAGIVTVLAVIAAERVHSAIDHVWSVEQERRYLAALSTREAVHLAVDDGQAIVGLQIVDLWSGFLGSMAHVGQVGTFILPNWRGRGIGRQLWGVTLDFARAAAFRKLVVQVRASNVNAQDFYRRLGFHECGRLTQQVIIDDVEDDEVFMELFV